MAGGGNGLGGLCPDAKGGPMTKRMHGDRFTARTAELPSSGVTKEDEG